MLEKFNNKEKPKKVELKIIEPRGDKNFMIGFTCRTEKECEAYNTAIKIVLERKELELFHQIGSKPDNPNAPGYHGWEIWKRKVTKEDLEKLLPEIDKEAQEFLKGI
jgi:hypothetical protein